MPKNNGQLKQRFTELLGITLGAVIMGISLSVFLAPFKIAPGGVSGLATVIHYLTGARIGILIFLINIPIFILGYVSFDRRFVILSVYGTLLLSASAEIAGMFKLPTDDTLLACVFGGAIMGFGISLVIRSGGSTGGTDILALVIRKNCPNISVGQLFLIIDGIIITLAGIVFKSGETVLYSAAALIVSGYITDISVEGVKFARLVYIISDKCDAITDGIYNNLKRGVTGIKSVSMYTKKERKILMCVIRKRELYRLKRIIKSEDPTAFIIVTDAKEVAGNGFNGDL